MTTGEGFEKNFDLWRDLLNIVQPRLSLFLHHPDFQRGDEAHVDVDGELLGIEDIKIGDKLNTKYKHMKVYKVLFDILPSGTFFSLMTRSEMSLIGLKLMLSGMHISL